MNPALLPLFLVSAAAVGMEIALTRFFAVASFSEYGYWVISIAMTGFAVSGVVNAALRVGSFANLATTYGFLVIGKVVALTLLRVAGWLHRRRTVPRFLRNTKRHFRRSCNSMLSSTYRRSASAPLATSI